MRALKPYEIHLLFAGGLYVLSLLVYSNSFQGPFVFDDHLTIRDNPSLRMTVVTLDALFRAGFENGSRHSALANISFAFNYYFDNYRVLGFHLVNVLIHIANGLLIYCLVIAVGRTQNSDLLCWRWVAFVSGLVFLVHPIQTQAVSYIAQRTTSLAGFFYLLTLWLYVMGRQSVIPAKRVALWCGAGLAGVIALASKEMTMSLPLVIVLWLWCFDRERLVTTLKRTWPLALLVFGVFAAVLVASFVPAGESGELRGDTLLQRLMTQCRVITVYLGLVLWPDPARFNLLHDTDLSQGWFSPPATVVGLMVFVGLGGVALWLKRTFPLVAFGLIWLLLHLVFAFPFESETLVSEHRMYLPMVGLSVVTGYVLVGVCARWRVVGIVLIIAIVVYLSSATFLRNAIWQDRLTLWVDVVNKTPDNPIALNYLGLALFDKGFHAEAVTQFTEALFHQPDYAQPYNNLGVLMAMEGRYSESLHHFRQALSISPDDPQAHHNLGHTYAALGRDADAIEALRSAISADPHYAKAHIALATVLLKVGKPTVACDHLKAAHRLKPRDPQVKAAIAKCRPLN